MTNVLDKARVMNALRLLRDTFAECGATSPAIRLSVFIDEIHNNHYDACKKKVEPFVMISAPYYYALKKKKQEEPKKDDMRAKLDGMLNGAEIDYVGSMGEITIPQDGVYFWITIKAHRNRSVPKQANPPNYTDGVSCCSRCTHRKITHSGNCQCSKYNRVVDWCDKCDTFERKKE